MKKMGKKQWGILLLCAVVFLSGVVTEFAKKGDADGHTVILEDEDVALAKPNTKVKDKAATVTKDMMESLEKAYTDSFELKNADLSKETSAMVNSEAALPTMLMPEASGEKVKKTAKAEIDYSNTEDGYVMVRYTAKTTKRIKAQVKGPDATYTYNIPVGAKWTTLPLTAGNGSYKITVYQNVTGSKYAAVTSVTTGVKLADEFAPYIRPNQYVNYEAAPKTIAKAAELTKGTKDTMAKVEKVYDYVVDNLRYDYDRAATVKSGYLPELDSVLAEKKGICFDYASLMTGMLRSQGVPCRLLIGYAGTQYHAWISVWTAEQGWVDGVIRFNGTSWQRMDPTFASTAQRSSSVMNYIAADANYVVSYQY